MEKIKFNFYYIKKYAVSMFVLSFVVTLILFSNSNFEAAKSGLKLWANSVVPSLFPFLVGAEILCNTNLINLAREIFKQTC